jgi:hypothetical protein
VNIWHLPSELFTLNLPNSCGLETKKEAKKIQGKHDGSARFAKPAHKEQQSLHFFICSFIFCLCSCCTEFLITLYPAILSFKHNHSADYAG